MRGKTGEREVVCNVGTEAYLRDLVTYRTKDANGSPDLNELVFCHGDGKRIGSFKKRFKRACREAGVLHGSYGKRRVPYSLRHTYATMRITEGVSVFQLAATMGTSIEMILDFYGKKRVRDPKMATEITKESTTRFQMKTAAIHGHEFSMRLNFPIIDWESDQHHSGEG